MSIRQHESSEKHNAPQLAETRRPQQPGPTRQSSNPLRIAQLNAHAALQTRAEIIRSIRVADAVFHLQRQYGNHHVQRLVTAIRGRQPPDVQHDLVRQPPGRIGEPPALTEDQVNEAIDFNTRRYTERSIRALQAIVGASQTGIVDADTVHMITEWQADFRLEVDGKIGIRTLRPIVQEVIAEGDRLGAIWLIIDGHNLSTQGLDSIRYDRGLADDNAVTSGSIPGRSTVRVGPAAFAQGYEGLVHTIAHELDHVQRRLAGEVRQPIREFLAEAVEIMSVGMLPERLAGAMDDARRALHFWNLMTDDEHRTHWARFEVVRGQVRRRFDAASAAQQATHQVTMTAYDAVVEPAAAP
jgi:hypothetical protein